MVRALTLLAAATALLLSRSAGAQVRFRRPIDPAPAINYGYDNNGSAGGCRDYTCGGRCYDGHTGTDIPVPLGTPVLAGAAGTVIATNNGCANYGGLGNTCGGRCGNYVQLQHADGTRTIYCHMQLNSIAVSRGQSVGCGQVIGRSASSGSSTGPHLHFGWSSGGVSRDPFTGGCSNGGGRWVEQRPYPNTPGASCAGPPPPPPPPPCIARSGPFGWSCSGPIAGMTCTQIAEAADPHTWGDNYFCSDIDRGVRWSSAGPIAGMRCIAINESSEPASHAWSDNYLCVPTWSPYRFAWGTAGPISGMTCLKWAEPADPHTWEDNYLCWTRDDQCARREPPFTWSCGGPVAGQSCTRLLETSDPHTWEDNFLCAAQDLGLRWSSAGPIAGMTCTPVSEGSEPSGHTWNDNFLCAPPNSEYAFRWSSAGPIAGMSCVQWYEPADPHTWEDNFLCWRFTPRPVIDAGTPSQDAGITTDAVAPRDAPIGRPDAPDASPFADVVSEDLPTTDDAGDPADASAEDASMEDLFTEEEVAIEEGAPAAIEGGCGCRARGPSGPRGGWGALALLGMLGIGRRRGPRGREG